MNPEETKEKLEFYGGRWMCFLPFVLAFIGLVYIALKNANIPAYWAVFLLPIIISLPFAKSKKIYSEVIIEGVRDELVAIMVMALMLAGIIGAFLANSGLIETLVIYLARAHLEANFFLFATLLLTALIAFATGTSLGTMFTVGPILYPAGYLLGANPALLIGAIISGAAFGDNLAPVSDVTIASATTQGMDIGGVVRSRLKYSLPALAISGILYFIVGRSGPMIEGHVSQYIEGLSPNPITLLMFLVPIAIVVAALSGQHLVTALSYGVITGMVVGLGTGIFKPSDIISVPEPFAAGGIIVEGLNNSISTVFFVLIIFPMINILRRGGGLEMILNFLSKIVKGPKSAETAIVGMEIVLNVASGVNTVAIVASGEIANKLGKKHNITGYRRANLLACAGTTFNYILPFMVPVLIGASFSTMEGLPADAPAVSPMVIGLSEFYPWVMLGLLIFAIVTGYGRTWFGDKGPV
ncbi:sodium:proton antiporter [Candidatus Atribacteria bacterium 1244-E10-H5-B2]|nr:MAG: sodium:proton antiporter [Candidatus Atribacteria bacterium 1244-E10-H5-B2]